MFCSKALSENLGFAAFKKLNFMDKNRQRIAIAEACGWKECRFTPAAQLSEKPFNVWTTSKLIGIHPFDDKHDGEKGLPDYPHSLQAMHEAEKTLSCTLFVKDTDGMRTEVNLYLTWLTRICGNSPIAFATAAQRAEAFLRTIGKWEE